MPRQLLEVADVARVLGLTPEMVRIHTRAGRLRVVTFTPRGVRLFDPREVERFRAERERETARRGRS